MKTEIIKHNESYCEICDSLGKIDNTKDFHAKIWLDHPIACCICVECAIELKSQLTKIIRDCEEKQPLDSPTLGNGSNNGGGFRRVTGNQQ